MQPKWQKGTEESAVPETRQKGQCLKQDRKGNAWSKTERAMPEARQKGQCLKQDRKSNAWSKTEREVPEARQRGQCLKQDRKGSAWNKTEREMPEKRQKHPQRYNSCPNIVLYPVISLSLFLFALGCFIFPSWSYFCLSFFFLLYPQNAELSVFLILLIKDKPLTTEYMLMFLSRNPVVSSRFMLMNWTLSRTLCGHVPPSFT